MQPPLRTSGLAVRFAWNALSPRQMIPWLPPSPPTGLCLNVLLLSEAFPDILFTTAPPTLHTQSLSPLSCSAARHRPLSISVDTQLTHLVRCLSPHYSVSSRRAGMSAPSVHCLQGLALGWHSVNIGTEAYKQVCQQGYGEYFMKALGFR